MRRHFLVIALLSAVLAGCKADPYKLVPVTGTVTSCEGKPAAGGVVVFAPIDNPDVTGRKSGPPAFARHLPRATKQT